MLSVYFIGCVALASGADAKPEPDVAELVAQANNGDPQSRMQLAQRYRDGKGVERDYAEAMKWAHMVADSGDPAAMDFVGWMYFVGRGVQHNPEIAVGYFKAASGKSATAAWNLGQCYFAAQGVDQNIGKALAAWKQAAALGHGRSAATAAMVYLAGDGVPADPKEARKLAELAAGMNDPSGLVVLGEIQFRAG
ncbi:MAG: tetratricopeptide repeat protein, partial [Planctomycetia bacterium]